MFQRELNFWVLGGDRRQAALARALAEDGHTVHAFALKLPEALPPTLSEETTLARCERADCIVLPLPVSDGAGRLNAPLGEGEVPLDQLMAQLPPRPYLCGGRVDGETRRLAEVNGLTLRDYFAREELAVANAVPTAEGAVQLAMERLPITIHGARVLILGYGRVGQLTARRFSALGARVTVAARRCEALAWARAEGCAGESLDRLRGWLCGYDLVINTIPAPVLGREELADLKEGCLVLDLASRPGGVDRQAAAQLGIHPIHALGLPGKVAPVTAGLAIKTTIYLMLREAGF